MFITGLLPFDIQIATYKFWSKHFTEGFILREEDLFSNEISKLNLIFGYITLKSLDLAHTKN